MTLEIRATPLGANGVDLSLAVDRGVALDPSLRDAFAARDRGAENLDRLFSGALCVTSGQQPGLFTGPLFTLYKAVSAVALARTFEVALDRPVVPVFWVAGDDHDFAEANHIHLIGKDNEIERLALRARKADAPTTPLSREVIGSEISEVIDRLTELTPENEFRAEVLSWLTRHYRHGADMSSAFRNALAELLGPAGLVVFDPTDREAKRVAAPLIIRVLEGAEALDADLRSRADALVASGRPAPVTTQGGNTLVMLDGERGRDRLVMSKGEFKTRRFDEHWTLDALREVARQAPERLSANVLLRPAIEAALLPTVAYVAGPGEIDYLPQTKPVFEALGIRPQLVVPRWSGVVVENRVRKTLDRYDLRLEDLSAGQGQLEARIVEQNMPAAIADAIQRLRQAVDREFPTLIKGASEIDPTLEKPVESVRNQIMKGIEHMEKRVITRLKQQNETLVRQIAHARSSTYPNGRPQERVLNVLQYLVKYGPAFLQEIERACDQWATNFEPANRRSQPR